MKCRSQASGIEMGRPLKFWAYRAAAAYLLGGLGFGLAVYLVVPRFLRVLGSHHHGCSSAAATAWQRQGLLPPPPPPQGILIVMVSLWPSLPSPSFQVFTSFWSFCADGLLKPWLYIIRLVPQKSLSQHDYTARSPVPAHPFPRKFSPCLLH